MASVSLRARWSFDISVADTTRDVATCSRSVPARRSRVRARCGRVSARHTAKARISGRPTDSRFSGVRCRGLVGARTGTGRRRILRASFRPVLKHGPRSLTCARVAGCRAYHGTFVTFAKPVHVEGVMKVNGEDGVPSTRSAVIGTAAGHPHSRGVSTARRGCGQSSFGAAVGLRRTEAHL